MSQRQKVRIKEIIQETTEAKSFVLETVDGKDISYKPGQFLTFIFETPFGEQRRNYSISSTPALPESLQITIKRLVNGFFSRKLVDTAKPGETLTTIGASGFFTLPNDVNNYEQLFLLAAGSGITPVFSILKTVLHQHPKINVVLIYSNRSKEDTIFYEALHQLKNKYPSQIEIVWLFSNAPNYTRARLSNWLLSELLKKHLTAPPEKCLFYLCGPFGYMRMITITLLSAGIKAANIRKEEFVITVPNIPALPPDISAQQVKLTLDKKQYEFRSEYPQTILQSAKLAGIELPYSCETGRCGACAAICKQGKVWMKYNEVLTDEDIKNNRALTCTGYPVFGNVELDFDNL